MRWRKTDFIINAKIDDRFKQKEFRTFFRQTYISLCLTFFCPITYFFQPWDFPDQTRYDWHIDEAIVKTYLGVTFWRTPKSFTPSNHTLIESGWDPETNSNYFLSLEKEKIINNWYIRIIWCVNKILHFTAIYIYL